MKKYLLTLISAFSLFTSVSTVFAQSFPDKNILKDLEKYTNQNIECAEFSCNSVNQLKLDLNNKEITASFFISSRKSSFIELPFKSEEFKLHTVLLDNKPWYQIVNNDNIYSVVVPQGEHVVSVKLQLNGNLLSLNTKIPNIEVSSGLSLDERNGSSIVSIKENKSENANTSNIEKSNYPTESFYQVSRTLYLNNSWKLVTQISPLFDTTKSTTLEIPLLKGEKILNSDIKVENEKAIVNLSNQVVTWESSLSSVNQLEIPAIQTDSYNQVFSLSSSNLWKYSAQGKNPFSISGDVTSWSLWNGEKLNFEFKAPLAVSGKTLSLSGLNVVYSQKHETNFYDYSLNAYTSLAGKTFFTIPEDYKIDFLKINQQSVNIDKNTKKIPVDLNFGSNNIEFRISTTNNQYVFKTFPHVVFPETVYMAKSQLNSNDWIIYSGGADINTEYILFSSLIILLIVALITKKINPSLHIFVIAFILFGFLQNSLQIMLLLPVLLGLIKFKDLIAQRFEKNKVALEYNTYQFFLIFTSAVFLISFLVTLKLGLLDSPSSWILSSTSDNGIFWNSEIYSSSPLWYIEIDSTVYHIIMFVWAIFVSYHLINISKLAFKSIFSYELWIKKQSVKPVITEIDSESNENSDNTVVASPNQDSLDISLDKKPGDKD